MLVIIDPSLKSYVGHFLTYDTAIAEELDKRGRKCVTLASANLRASELGDLTVVPCFRYGLEDASHSARELSEAFYEDMLRCASKVPESSDATYFLHTCTARQIEPAVRFISQTRYAKSKLIILLRYSITINPVSPDMNNVEAYRAALRSIAKHQVSNRVILTTDSTMLAQEYKSITDLPITVLPIPHVTRAEGERGDVKTIAYLGNARGSKGFQYLPFLVSKIRPELDSGKWQAEFQANVMFARDSESVTAVAALRSQPVKLHEKELSIQAYRALLARASLIVIPYWTLWYHSQTSGVFAEAIGTGIPVVVPRGTWMARELGDRPAGTLFFPGDRIDLVRAVKDAMARFDELSVGARVFQHEWEQQHNPGSFIDALLATGASI